MPLEYLFVIDFEATCEAQTEIPSQRPKRRYEIIEFPIVLVDLKAGEVIDHFHSFVRPSKDNEILSDFCTALTGITQEQVAKAPTFLQVLSRVTTWLEGLSIDLRPPIDQMEQGPPRDAVRNWAIVTDGRTDLEQFFSDAIESNGIAYPAWALGPYIDSRAAFAKATNAGSVPIVQQLQHFRLDFVGRQHSGLDDARNIARIALQLRDKLEPNRFLEEAERGDMDGQNIRRRRRVAQRSNSTALAAE